MLYRWRKFPFSLTRSALRSSLLVKCHPNSWRAVFSIQRYSIDLVFQLLEFSIHKPTSSPLQAHWNFSLCTRSCHPFNTKNGFIKGEALRLLTTNSVKDNFSKQKRDFEFKQRLSNRSYPTALAHKILTEVQFSDRTEALPNKTKKAKEIWVFATTDNPTTPNHTTFRRLATRSALDRASLTEQTKLAPDHLLTAPSFSLPTTIFYIYKKC